jgi:hypothetical protein
VERLVSGRRSGASPGDPPDRAARRHVIRLEVSADAFAMFREAMAKLRRDSGGPLDDDAAVLMVTRHVLGGPTDAGRASYQVALTVCDRCRRGEQQGRGEPIPVEPEVVEMAECDAQHVSGAVSPHAADVRAAVFRAMRGLGFKESDARRAVEHASAKLDAQTTTEALLRAALAATQPKRGRAHESSAEGRK